MESIPFLPFISDELQQLGLVGVIIALLILAVVGMWVQLRYERKCNAELTEKALAMAQEAQIMIERVAGD